MLPLYLPSTITIPIYFYIGWNDLRRHFDVSDIVWYQLIQDMSQDTTFKEQFTAYTALQCIKNSHQEMLLFFINHSIHQPLDKVPHILNVNRDFMRLYVKNNKISNIEYIRPHLQLDIDIMASFVDINDRWRYVNVDLQLNEDFLLKLIKHSSSWFIHISNDFKQNKEFVLKALNQNYHVWYHIDVSLQADKGFIVKAMDVNPRLIWVKELWHAHPKLMGKLVEDNSKAIKMLLDDCDGLLSRKYFVDICKINPKILIQAILDHGTRVLDYTDSTFTTNKPLLLELLKITSNSYRDYKKVITYISPQLKTDVNFMTTALRMRSDLWYNVIGNLVPGDIFSYYNRASWKLN